MDACMYGMYGELKEDEDLAEDFEDPAFRAGYISGHQHGADKTLTAAVDALIVRYGVDAWDAFRMIDDLLPWEKLFPADPRPISKTSA